MNEAEDKLYVYIEGWLSEWHSRRIEENVYKAVGVPWGSLPTTRLYPNASREDLPIAYVLEQATMTAVGETHLEKKRTYLVRRGEWKPQTLYVKVRVEGWIQKELATPNLAETQFPLAELYGWVFRGKRPVIGIVVKLREVLGGTVVSKETDSTGRYHSLNQPSI